MDLIRRAPAVIIGFATANADVRRSAVNLSLAGILLKVETYLALVEPVLEVFPKLNREFHNVFEVLDASREL